MEIWQIYLIIGKYIRNLPLQDVETAKVSDFGLSRKLYEYSSYSKQSKVRIKLKR